MERMDVAAYYADEWPVFFFFISSEHIAYCSQLFFVFFSNYLLNAYRISVVFDLKNTLSVFIQLHLIKNLFSFIRAFKNVIFFYFNDDECSNHSKSWSDLDSIFLLHIHCFNQSTNVLQFLVRRWNWHPFRKVELL